MDQILTLINEMSPYLLLGFLLAGLMHAFVPGQLYSRYLSAPNFSSVVRAALLGVPLPLCSCGVIPTAMSLRREGASRGATTSFLVATPQTGVDSIIATWSLMGLPFAIVRPIAALCTALFGGVMVNTFDADGDGAHSVPAVPAQASAAGHHHPAEGGCCADGGCGCCGGARAASFTGRMKEALHYAFVDMMADIGKWLVIGLVVAALITVFVPASFFSVFADNSLLSMLLVLALAVPMYLCATGSIPIAVALMIKGLTPGAGLVMLMAGPASNVASILVIRKVLGARTQMIYLASIIIGAVAFGLAIDYLLPREWFVSALVEQDACCVDHISWTSWLCTALLLVLLLNALVVLPMMGKRHAHGHHDETAACCGEGSAHVGGHAGCSCGHGVHGDEGASAEAAAADHCAAAAPGAVVVLTVKGMNCSHCRAAVERALLSVEGVAQVDVDLLSATARVTGTASASALCAAVEGVGFSAELQ